MPEYIFTFCCKKCSIKLSFGPLAYKIGGVVVAKVYEHTYTGVWDEDMLSHMDITTLADLHKLFAGVERLNESMAVIRYYGARRNRELSIVLTKWYFDETYLK